MAKYTLKRRAEQQETTRRRIVEAVVELHRTIGPAQTTITAIAERAGVERLTVYRHFPEETELFRACAEHWRAANPPPDVGHWVAIVDPRERLRLALAEVYAYYQRTHAMLGNVLRDADLLPALANQLAGYGQFLDVASTILAVGWDVDEPRERLVTAALVLALHFETWRSLVERQGLTEPEAAELMVGLICAAARDTTSVQ
jgi:AcrR family transcriptional regulator